MFKYLKEHKKVAAIIGIVFWICLITTFYIFLSIEQKKQIEKTENYEKKYNVKVDKNELFNVLENNKYNYKYIVIDEKMYLYEGIHETSKDNIEDPTYKYLNINNIINLVKDESFNKGSLEFENNNIYVKIRVLIDNTVNIEIENDSISYQLKYFNIDGYQVKGSGE